MSHHDHDEHNHELDHGHHEDGHHEVGPAQATEIVPETSPEDMTLSGLIVVCAIALMVGLGSWMNIEMPSGGGHGHGGEAHESHNSQESLESHESPEAGHSH
ncbi:MAG: hypothetical protein R3C24_17330 [Cyanobacteriota/Melainabacteria group bacterium]